ncbi:MAG: Integrase core domain protein [Candidatus Scalindua rubra]|uniref:Integrase core domain protein n=1 Tax=Candidatus Scalindua rubra TaxID=1872076 RepID=A0A1E3X260_9BACT|nr:MAG: Integrase core domain protein [Candidatus Scalindua rubra]
MKHYPPAGGLTLDQRYIIKSMLKIGYNQTEIAKVLGVHKSTVSRELIRNRGGRGYRPKQANAFSKERHQAKVRPRIDGGTWAFIERLICKEWSPEQISGWIKKNMDIAVSHEWIYQYILKDKLAGGSLYIHLRCKQKGKKRYGSNDRRGNLKNRVSIDQRPSLVDDRSRIGDWPARPHSSGAGGEADTIIGKAHKQAIVSLTERKSGLALIYKVDRRTKEKTEEAMRRLLGSISDQVHTITSDNGKEFGNHETVAKGLECDFYFAHAYSSWERGTNENTNGLIRQYFPKNRDFRTITDKELIHAMKRLNNRPRKRLGYKTPNEVFFGESHTVALTT